jgi:GT2 family glycosyltransferase
MSDTSCRHALSIVIVNWNSHDLLDRAIQSLRKTVTSSTDYEILVVDNGSDDDSVLACEKIAGLRVIQNERNLGFGRACNIGAAASKGKYLIFLNPDCEVRSGSVERCLEELQRSDVGVCGIALVDERGVITRTCHSFPSLRNFVYRILGLHLLSHRYSDGTMQEWDHAHDADVDHVIGAFYGIRRNLFCALGGFDERYFVYLEDLDLSLRVRQAGYRVRFIASPSSFHVGGGVSRHVTARRLSHATQSRILYAYKHFPRWQARLHLILTLLIEPLTRTALAVALKSSSRLSDTLRGFGIVWRDLPATMRLVRRQ